MAGKFDHGVGAALYRGARVVGGGWLHHRVQRGQQGGAALQVEASGHGEQRPAPGDGQRPPFAGVRIRIGTVGVDVGPDPVAGLRHLGRPLGGGQPGQDLVEGRHRLDADVCGQVADGAYLFGGHGAGVGGGGQGRQFAQQPASG